MHEALPREKFSMNTLLAIFTLEFCLTEIIPLSPPSFCKKVQLSIFVIIGVSKSPYEGREYMIVVSSLEKVVEIRLRFMFPFKRKKS